MSVINVSYVCRQSQCRVINIETLCQYSLTTVLQLWILNMQWKYSYFGLTSYFKQKYLFLEISGIDLFSFNIMLSCYMLCCVTDVHYNRVQFVDRFLRIIQTTKAALNKKSAIKLL